MLDAQFWTFLVAITLLTISPGVDTLLVLRNSSRGGWKDGLVSSFGICSGLFVHAAISAIGISVILLQSAWAFSVLKIIGALYLIWLGIQSLRSIRRLPVEAVLVKPKGFNIWRSLREGLLSNVLNPKAVIFYMAFLPQFIDPQQSALTQSMMLASVHFTIGMIWLGFLTFILWKLKTAGIGEKAEKLIQGMTGSVMLALGIKLAFEEVRV